MRGDNFFTGVGRAAGGAASSSDDDDAPPEEQRSRGRKRAKPARRTSDDKELDSEEEELEAQGAVPSQRRGARENKNRPMEQSSTRAVGRYAEVVQPVRKQSRDPRFESLAGTYDEATFRKSHAFLYDENLPNERKRLAAKLKKGNSAARKQSLKEQLASVDQELQRHKDRVKHQHQQLEMKRGEKEAVKAGKIPYFKTKQGERKETLVEKYKALKKAGKLEAFLAKRRKKNAAKDHRYIPSRRRSAVTDA